MLVLDITFTSAKMSGVEELCVSRELGRALDKAIYDCNVGRNDGLYEYRDMPYNQENLDYALRSIRSGEAAGIDLLAGESSEKGLCLFDKIMLSRAVELGLDPAELLAAARTADYLVGHEQWQENPAAIIAAATFMDAPLRLSCKSMPEVCGPLASLHGLCLKDSLQTAEILTAAAERGLGALYYTIRTSVDMLMILRSQSASS